MSASLTYVSAPLSDPVRAAVRDSVAREAAGCRWWAESLSFFDDPARPGQLVGNMKLFRLIDDPAADSFMASTDMGQAVRCLEAASAQFGVGWQLFLQDTPVGGVTDGRRDEKARKAVEGLLEICKVLGNDPAQMDRNLIFREHVPG